VDWVKVLTRWEVHPDLDQWVGDQAIDSYNGSSLQSFTGHLNSKQLPLEASFSPDSQFVISGSSDGRIHIWNSENGQKVCVLNGDHRSPVQCVQFNPKYMMMASACQVMSFWLPTIEDEVPA